MTRKRITLTPGETWLRLLAWMGGGLVIYVSYGRRHSKVQRSAQRSRHATGR